MSSYADLFKIKEEKERRRREQEEAEKSAPVAAEPFPSLPASAETSEPDTDSLKPYASTSTSTPGSARTTRPSSISSITSRPSATRTPSSTPTTDIEPDQHASTSTTSSTSPPSTTDAALADQPDLSAPSSTSRSSTTGRPSTTSPAGPRLTEQRAAPRSSRLSRSTSTPRAAFGSAPPIAPERDFQRVPNSVTRHAIPDGLFRGKSKQVWDYLWSVSRGAITPSRFVRRSRRDIRIASGLGSMVTVDAAIAHLQAVGLLAVSSSVGTQTGNEYEIFTPEEAGASFTSTPSSTSASRIPGAPSSARLTSLGHNLVSLDQPYSGASRDGLSPLDPTAYDQPHTFLKTAAAPDDEEPQLLAAFVQTLAACAEAITHAPLTDTPDERERWNELAKVLAAEFEDAAGRAEIVSSFPAFCAAHLRRRFAARSTPSARRKTGDPPSQKLAATQGVLPCAGDEELRTSILNRLEEKTAPDEFATWFKPILQAGREGDFIHFLVPNDVFADWLERNHQDLMSAILVELGFADCKISFISQSPG